MQDKYMSQSVHLASLVQKHFRNTCRRVDRGCIRQVFCTESQCHAKHSGGTRLHLHSEEERYLNTDAGTTTLANGIFALYLTYKREQEIRLNASSQTILPEDIPQPEEATASAGAASQTEKAAGQSGKPTPQRSEKAAVAQTEDNAPCSRYRYSPLPVRWQRTTKRLKGLKNVDYYKEGGLYKYTYGASSDYNKVLRTKRSITAQFKDAFIIAFRMVKVNVNAAVNEFKNKRNK